MNLAERLLVRAEFRQRQQDSGFRAAVHFAHARKRGLPLAEKTVFFEASAATAMADSPFAMFKEMLGDPYYGGYSFIWSIKGEDNPYRQRFASHPQVRFVGYRTQDHADALWTSKYLVTDTVLPSYFTKRPGQVCVATWQGTPVETLGRDRPDAMGVLRNLTRTYLQTDHLVMPNRFASQTVLRATDVTGIFPGTVLEEGLPRLDLSLNADRAEVASMLHKTCRIDPAKKLVLYDPVWRTEVDQGSRDPVEETVRNIRSLAASLPEDWGLLLKVHKQVRASLSRTPEIAGIPSLPDWFDVNEVLSVTDVLVTDYSPFLFDMLALDRPVVFFAPGIERDTLESRLYFDMHDLPGPVCTTAEQVAGALRDIGGLQERFAPLSTSMRAEYCPGGDGRASARVCDAIFKGVPAGSAYRSSDETRLRVIVGGSDFEGGPATFEAVALSHEIDHDRYDLTILLPGKATPEREHHLRMLHPATRVFYTFGHRPMTSAEHLQMVASRQLEPQQRCTPEAVAEVAPFYERERRRLLGDARFDVGLTFTDKLTEATYLLSVADFGRRLMCLTGSGDEVMRRLAAPLIAERFEHVLVTPKAEGSRVVQDIRQMEENRTTSGAHSKLVAIDRFAGYTVSVAALRSEIEDQLIARVLSELTRRAHATGVPLSPDEGRRIESRLESALDRLTGRMLAYVTDAHERHGLDLKAHNQAVLQAYENAFGSPLPSARNNRS